MHEPLLEGTADMNVVSRSASMILVSEITTNWGKVVAEVSRVLELYA